MTTPPVFDDLRDRVARVLAAALDLAPEALLSLAFILGWLLITDGLAHLHALAAPVVWRISLGLLAFSLGGLRTFARLAYHGLYELTHDDG